MSRWWFFASCASVSAVLTAQKYLAEALGRELARHPLIQLNRIHHQPNQPSPESPGFINASPRVHSKIHCAISNTFIGRRCMVRQACAGLCYGNQYTTVLLGGNVTALNALVDSKAIIGLGHSAQRRLVLLKCHCKLRALFYKVVQAPDLSPCVRQAQENRLR